MSENLKSDRESNNTTKHIESTKQDSIKETSINTESSKLISQKTNDTINKDKIKRDSHNDEIVFEAKYKLGLWDYCVNIFFFIPFSCLLVYTGISLVIEKGYVSLIIFILIGAMGIFFTIYDIIYLRKNRFYITNQGIGFERRYWWRMQKRFFKFGEVEMMYHISIRKLMWSLQYDFVIFPIDSQVVQSEMAGLRITSKIKYKIKILNKNHDIDIPFDFIKEKTARALESQNKSIQILNFGSGWSIFGKGSDDESK